MRAKCLPLYLDADTYRRLEEHARTQERDALQQARWIIRQWANHPPEPATAVACAPEGGREAAQ